MTIVGRLAKARFVEHRARIRFRNTRLRNRSPSDVRRSLEAMVTFLEILNQAIEIVTSAYPGSCFYEADGTSSIGMAFRAADVDIWRFVFLRQPKGVEQRSLFWITEGERLENRS